MDSRSVPLRSPALIMEALWKRLALFFWLAIFLFLPGHTPAAPFPDAEERIVRFYQKNYSHLPGFRHVAESAFWLRYYARLAGIEDHLPTLLCIAHRESAFDPRARAKREDSSGFMQTRRRDERKLRLWWKDSSIYGGRGGLLPGRETIQAQAAFGVAEYWEHLNTAGGWVDQALGRYNAGKRWDGRLGKRYRYRVLLSRSIIFDIRMYDTLPNPDHFGD